VWVLYNQGQGQFTVPAAPLTSGLNPVGLITADLNGDGHPDLVSANQNSNNVSVFLDQFAPVAAQAALAIPANLDYGQLAQATFTLTPPPGGPIPTGTVTFQIDGVPDIVVSLQGVNWLLDQTVQLRPGVVLYQSDAGYYRVEAFLDQMSAGAHTITADYSGDDKLGTATAQASVTVSGPPPAQISGTVFQDINIDGVQDPKEPGLAGVKIYLDLDGSGVLKGNDPTAVTDANGHFQFSVANPGTYTVREVLYGGVLLDAPVQGGYQVTVTSGATVSGENFADVPTSIALPLTVPLGSPFAKHGDADADFVEALYRSVLTRNSDPAGLAYWTGALKSGRLSRPGVADGIRKSAEHFQNEVTDYYFTACRTPQGCGTGCSDWNRACPKSKLPSPSSTLRST
jgi:hypothetical protein